jgi:hypothetical protein
MCIFVHVRYPERPANLSDCIAEFRGLALLQYQPAAGIPDCLHSRERSVNSLGIFATTNKENRSSERSSGESFQYAACRVKQPARTRYMKLQWITVLP